MLSSSKPLTAPSSYPSYDIPANDKLTVMFNKIKNVVSEEQGKWVVIFTGSSGMSSNTMYQIFPILYPDPQLVYLPLDYKRLVPSNVYKCISIGDIQVPCCKINVSLDGTINKNNGELVDLLVKTNVVNKKLLQPDNNQKSFSERLNAPVENVSYTPQNLSNMMSFYEKEYMSDKSYWIVVDFFTGLTYLPLNRHKVFPPDPNTIRLYFFIKEASDGYFEAARNMFLFLQKTDVRSRLFVSTQKYQENKDKLPSVIMVDVPVSVISLILSLLVTEGKVINFLTETIPNLEEYNTYSKIYPVKLPSINKQLSIASNALFNQNNLIVSGDVQSLLKQTIEKEELLLPKIIFDLEL